MEYSAKPPTTKLKHLQLKISLFFRDKVDDVRSSTAAATLYDVPFRATPLMDSRNVVAVDEIRNWWTHPCASFTLFRLGWQRRCEDCCHRSLLWCVTSHSLLAAFQQRSNQPSCIHFWTVDLIAARWRTIDLYQTYLFFPRYWNELFSGDCTAGIHGQQQLDKKHSLHTVSITVTAPRRLWRKSIMLCYSIYIH